MLFPLDQSGFVQPVDCLGDCSWIGPEVPRQIRTGLGFAPLKYIQYGIPRHRQPISDNRVPSRDRIIWLSALKIRPGGRCVTRAGIIDINPQMNLYHSLGYYRLGYITRITIMQIRLVQSLTHRWRNVLPAGAPGCSQGTPYSFWAKEGDPSKLAVIFSGGGACWSGENCALHGKPFYRPCAGLEQDPSNLGGVFDTDNPENPLADYTLVYLPTCNGDIFLGDSVTTYDVPAMRGQPAGKIDILHKGYDNALCALDWMFKTYQHPKTVAVMGWSAGAIASPLYTHIVAQHYPDASVSHFADGGGAYRVAQNLCPSSNPGGQRTS